MKRVTFFKNKAKNIRTSCEILVKQYNGQVPKGMRELAGLPGIACKRANAIQQNAFGVVEGIVVNPSSGSPTGWAGSARRIR